MKNDPRKIMLPASYPKRTAEELLEAMLTYVDRTFRNLENASNPSANHLGEVGRLVTMASQIKSALAKKSGDDLDPEDMDDDELERYAYKSSKCPYCTYPKNSAACQAAHP